MSNLPFDTPEEAPHFDGPDYKPAVDRARLGGQAIRIWNLMIDGEWRSLSEIEDGTGDPQASISAQLRHFRKPRFGSHTLERRRRGEERKGHYEYRLTANPQGELEEGQQ